MLPNGAKLFVNTIPDAKNIYSDIIFECGSAYDTPEKSGLSHFLEHMLFELDPSIGAEELDKKFDELIAYKNASTSDYCIDFRNEVKKDDFKKMFGLVCHYIEHPDFTENERNLISLEKQRKIITKEKLLEGATQNEILFSKKRKTIFSETSFEKGIIGKNETINNITLKDLKEHYEKFFIPENMNIIITGNITFKEAEKIVKQCFYGRFLRRSDNKTLQRFNSAVSEAKKRFKRSKKTKVFFYENKGFDDDGGAHIELIFNGMNRLDKKFPALTLITNILNKELYEKIREKEKIAYYAYSYDNNCLKNDFFTIKSTIEEKDIEKFLNCVADVFAQILQEGISKEKIKNELKAIKARCDGSSDFQNIVSNHDIFVQRIKNANYKGIERNGYFLQKYNKLSSQDLVGALKEILKTEPMLTIFGKKYTKKIDEQKLKQMFSIESLMQRDYKTKKIDSIYANNQAIEEYNYFSSLQMQAPKSYSLLQPKLNAMYSGQEETSKSKEVNKPKEISNVIKNTLATRSNGNTNIVCLLR